MAMDLRRRDTPCLVRDSLFHSIPFVQKALHFLSFDFVSPGIFGLRWNCLSFRVAKLPCANQTLAIPVSRLILNLDRILLEWR